LVQGRNTFLADPAPDTAFRLCIDKNRCESQVGFCFGFVKIAHFQHLAGHLKDVDKGSTRFGELKGAGKF